MDDYEDIRQFSLKSNSTKLLYTYLSTLKNDKIPMQALDFLKDLPDLKSIDVVVFWSYASNTNR